MVLESITEDVLSPESLMNELLDSDHIPACYHEQFDNDMLNLLYGIEMGMLSSVKTQETLGELSVGEKGSFVATFKHEGSSSIQYMQMSRDNLVIAFRRNPNKYYNYSITPEIRNQVFNEVKATLIDGEGSVGRLVQNLIHSNKIQLI